jgi:cobalt-zinc-cadmium efflux system outer membrane protein
MSFYHYSLLLDRTQVFRISRLTSYLALSVMALLLSLSTLAQESKQSDTLTLSSAIKRTLAENPTLKVFSLRQASLYGQQQTQALTPGYQLGVEIENFAGSGALHSFDSAEFTVSLSSVIEMGGKRNARMDIGSHRNAILAAEGKIAALHLLAEVTRRYIDVLAAQANLSLANEATQLAEDTLLAVEKRAMAGSTPKAEIKRAMAAVGNTRLVAATKNQQFSATKYALALLWNERWDENSPSFSTVAGNLYHFSNDIPFEKLYAKVQQNPAQLAFASEERLKSAQLRLAKSQSSTDIKWTLGIKQLQDIGDTALVAGFSVPLFRSSNNTGAIISAQAERDAVQARKNTALLQLHNQLQQAYSSRKQAIYTANNLREIIIPLLEEALAETKIAYQRGLYSYLDYLSARQELLIARRALIKSASAALRFGADIEQLIAEPLPASQHELPFSPKNKHFIQG